MFTKPPNHKLDTITAHLNINIDDRHRALDDAYASAQFYLYYLDYITKENNKLKKSYRVYIIHTFLQ